MTLAGFQTIGEAMKWASSALHRSRHQASSLPQFGEERDRVIRFEVETLLCWVTRKSALHLLTSMHDLMTTSDIADFQKAVEQRGQGQPLQYITGFADFYGRSFHVRPGCLIPRPETEVLAEAAIGWMARYQGQARVIDVGTGSGILAVTIALEVPETSVYAVDLSTDALQIATENATLLGANMVTFVHGDGVDVLVSGAQPSSGLVRRWNVVVSNPPYIPSSDVQTLDGEVHKWEPRLALDGGEDGLDIYRRLSAVGSRVFADGSASMFLEVGAGQAEAVRDLFSLHAAERWPGWSFGIIPDLRGIDRVVWGQRLEGVTRS